MCFYTLSVGESYTECTFNYSTYLSLQRNQEGHVVTAVEAVEEAVYKDFEKWSKENGNSNKEVGDFMEEIYAMKLGKENIFNKNHIGRDMTARQLRYLRGKATEGETDD